MSHHLILYYDEYHTPLEELAANLGENEPPVVLDIWLDPADVGRRLPGSALCEVIGSDAREEFCVDYLLPAIKANAVYQDACFLSAALSRPLLATRCARALEETAGDVLVHGFAGNDQLRFEMAMETIDPGWTVRSAASLLGSRNRRNDGSHTISANLWGSSTEGAELTAPQNRSVGIAGDPGEIETHIIGFKGGIPVSLDEEEMSLLRLIERLDEVAHGVSFRTLDVVEDGAVGLKARAIYRSPAAEILVAAHRDLERFVSTRHQNRFKPTIDRAWSDLVFDGFWFDEQRRALDAYIERTNRWVTGDVSVSIGPGGLRVDGRRSDHALFSDAESVHRLGQDLVVDGMGAVARALSAPMRASARRLAEATSVSEGV